VSVFPTLTPPPTHRFSSPKEAVKKGILADFPPSK
jgi:hypothetical protein